METAIIINISLIVIGFVLIVTEVIIGLDSLFDLVLSGSALAFGGGFGLVTQSALVGLTISIVLLGAYWLIGRQMVRSRLHVEGERTNADRILGLRATVQRIKDNGNYVVSIESEQWTAVSESDLKPGDHAQVVGVDGSIIHIAPIG